MTPSPGRAGWSGGGAATDDSGVAGGGTFVDPTAWLCDESACPAVIGPDVVYMDSEGHLTAPMALSLTGSLAQALPAIH